MTYMIKSKKMKNQPIPVGILKLLGYMPRHVGVDLGEVLRLASLIMVTSTCAISDRLTDTKKLDVPSARANV